MKRIFKYVGIVIGTIIGLIFLFLLASYINHKINLFKEDKLFLPNGQMIEVNGHNIHLYSEGEGDPTLVFMSGG